MKTFSVYISIYNVGCTIAEEIMYKKYYSIVRYPILDPKYVRGSK